jgi:hypothetical protein
LKVSGSPYRRGGLKKPETWLTLTRTMAQFALEYSVCPLFLFQRVIIFQPTLVLMEAGKQILLRTGIVVMKHIAIK